MNIWHFDGRLGRDAELRTTQSGEKVLGFAVANDIGFGERKTTQWVDCSIWGTRAEKLAPHLTRGTEVSIAGEVTLREIERRDGSKDKVLNVRVIEVSLHGGQRQGQQSDAGNGNGQRQDRPPAGNGTNGGARGQGNQGGSNRSGGQGRQGTQNPGPSGGSKDDDWDQIPF